MIFFFFFCFQPLVTLSQIPLTNSANNYQISELMPNPVPGPEEADKLPSLEEFTPVAGGCGP